MITGQVSRVEKQSPGTASILSRSIREDDKDALVRESGSQLDRVSEEDKENADGVGEAVNIPTNDLASLRDPTLPHSPKKNLDTAKQKIEEELRKSLARSAKSKA